MAKVKGKVLYKLKLDQRLQHWDDERYLRLMYRLRMGERLDLDNPVTYNAKLQWLKLNYDDPSTSFLVDKFEVKQWVADRIGLEHVIPSLGVYDDVDGINFDDLPDSFVLKTTHDSGGVVLVRNKKELDIPRAKEKLRRSMARRYFYIGREPHYRSLSPRVIAEPFLEDDEHGQLLDYKFFCFNGEVKAMSIASDRSSGKLKFDYFDANFSPLLITRAAAASTVLPKKPKRFEQMISFARTLSEGHRHVRVDLYEVNGRIYFGELTFFPSSGYARFTPPEWDKVWGEWLDLSAPIRDQ